MSMKGYAPILAIALMSLAAIFMMSPISQELSYHQFAGEKTFFGLPNFWNVISNIPFLFIGIVGLFFCFKNRALDARASWATFFTGVIFVGLGSAWYHLHPDNMTLIWDRLPMAVGFMGLFVALLSEYVDARAQKYLLLPCLLLGAGSVLLWGMNDDLRLYIWVQFFPLLTIVILLFFYRSHYAQKAFIAGALGFYVLAKLFELGDHQVYELTGHLLSGHPLKHLAAASGVALLYRMIKHRDLT